MGHVEGQEAADLGQITQDAGLQRRTCLFRRMKGQIETALEDVL